MSTRARRNHRAGRGGVQRRDDAQPASRRSPHHVSRRELRNDDRGRARGDAEGTRNERPGAEDADAERTVLEPSPAVRHRDARHDRRAHRDVLRVADAARQPTVREIDVTGPTFSAPASEVSVGRHEPAAYTCCTVRPACDRPVAQVPGVRGGLALRGERNGQRRLARERRRRDAAAGVRGRCERERRDSGEDEAAHPLTLAADGDGGDERDQVEQRRARPFPGRRCPCDARTQASRQPKATITGRRSTRPCASPNSEADAEDRRPPAERLEQRVAETAERELLDERHQRADDDRRWRRTPPHAPAPSATGSAPARSRMRRAPA